MRDSAAFTGRSIKTYQQSDFAFGLSKCTAIEAKLLGCSLYNHMTLKLLTNNLFLHCTVIETAQIMFWSWMGELFHNWITSSYFFLINYTFLLCKYSVKFWKWYPCIRIFTSHCTVICRCLAETPAIVSRQCLSIQFNDHNDPSLTPRTRGSFKQISCREGS